MPTDHQLEPPEVYGLAEQNGMSSPEMAQAALERADLVQVVGVVEFPRLDGDPVKLIHILRPPLPVPSFKESSEGYRVAGLVIQPQGYLYATVGVYQAPQIQAPVPAVAEPGTLAMVLCGMVVLWRVVR